MTGPHALSLMVRVLGASSAVVVLLLGYIYAVSEWKMHRTHDVPLEPLRTASSADGRDLSAMSWVRNVDFTVQEIDDLYVFLRAHHGLDTGAIKQ